MGQAKLPPYGRDEERVWTRVIPGLPGECWVWDGPLGERGYPIPINMGRRPDGSRIVKTPQQLAWQTTIGPIGPGMTVDHLCRNPPCCNPHHLDLVTREENTRRRDIPDRFPAVNPPMAFPLVERSERTHCSKGHALAATGWYTNGTGSRTCAECARERNRKPGAIANGAKTHCKRGHAYDAGSVVHRSDGRTERQCRVCARELAKQRKAQK